MIQVALPKALEDYVSKQIDSGNYQDAPELIRDALRLKMRIDQGYADRMDSLRAEIQKGWAEAERGEFVSLDMAAINDLLDSEIRGPTHA